jgi:hypothetical protein
VPGAGAEELGGMTEIKHQRMNKSHHKRSSKDFEHLGSKFVFAAVLQLLVGGRLNVQRLQHTAETRL